MYLFTPPGRAEKVNVKEPLWDRTYDIRGVTVLKESGLYTQVQNPLYERVIAAQKAYLGGHEYLVTNVEADSLTSAGYGDYLVYANVFGSGAYGSGPYGSGEYGG